MSRLTCVVGVVVSLLCAASSLVTGQGASQAPPTFNTHVAPILFANCVTCHRPGESAPMSLLTYSGARPWAAAIRSKVIAREMPPWFADPNYGDFSNRPRLTQGDIETIAAWAAAGAPEGAGAPPPAPVFQEGWSSEMGRPPDQILEAPFGELEVPATGPLPTFTVWLRLPFKFDRHVAAMELRPSNRRIVHHASVAIGTLPPRTRLGKAVLWPGGPSVDGVRFTNGDPDGAMPSRFGYPMLFYVPGGGFLKFPDGIVKRMSPGESLAWGLHLTPTGQAQKVRVRLGLWFARRPAHHEALTITANAKQIVDGREVAVERGRSMVPNIPAEAENWEITGQITFPDSVTLYALWPHMHFRGKDMTFILTRPDGRRETLLSVPKYSFDWQLTYRLASPLRIPANSTITAIAHYDNSAKNRLNPDPTQDVSWGEQSWNEMFNPFLEVSIDKDDFRFENVPRQ